MMSRVPRIRPLALAALAAVTACATNPATGARQLVLISESQEIQMGRDYDQQVVAQYGLYPDQGLQNYVHELGTRLAAQSERPHLPWTFRVMDDPIVNAFALPGGFIYITRGILAHMGSEAELAAVLSHEIGHVTARHSVVQISRAQLAQVGLVAGVLLRPELEGLAGVAGAGLGILFLKHGRDDERQADDLGLRYMLRGNYDPREMADVFTMLERVSAAHGGGRIPEWLSTHPNPGNRRERIQQQVAALEEDFSGRLVNRDAYLRRLDGMIFGDNPREGFFRAGEFIHPDLRFRFTFPQGWKTQNQKHAVIGVSDAEDAIMQITLAQEATADLAAQAFYSQQGVTGRAAPTRLNDVSAVAGPFSVQTESGILDGTVAFVSHEGVVLRLLAYATRQRWGQYEGSAHRAFGSFARLTDPALINVQPWRIAVATVPRAMSLQQFVQGSPSPVSLETIALINQLEPTAQLRAGMLVKRVVGAPLP